MLFSAALNDPNNRNLVLVSNHRTTAPALAMPAEIHLIDFNGFRTFQFVVITEKRANLLEHAPRGLVGHACLALNLLCRNAATSGTHQVHGVKPEPQRSARLLEDRSGHWGDHRTAVVTGVGRTPGYAMVLAILLALRAIGDAARITLFLEVFKTSFVIGETLMEGFYCQSEMLWNALCWLHNTNSMPFILLDVKG